jgi:glycerate-2-kinase
MSYHIDKNVHLVAFGKAAPKMVEAAEKILGNTGNYYRLYV